MYLSYRPTFCCSRKVRVQSSHSVKMRVNLSTVHCGSLVIFGCSFWVTHVKLAGFEMTEQSLSYLNRYWAKGLLTLQFDLDVSDYIGRLDDRRYYSMIALSDPAVAAAVS